jgi:hypothetical protein
MVQLFVAPSMVRERRPLLKTQVRTWCIVNTPYVTVWALGRGVAVSAASVGAQLPGAYPPPPPDLPEFSRLVGEPFVVLLRSA